MRVNMYPEVKIKDDRRHPTAQVHRDRMMKEKTGQKNRAAIASPNTVVPALIISA